MKRSRDASDEVEIHPQYDMAAQLDELFSVPAYRQPENPLIEVWREIGERLLALGERNLVEGVDAAGEFLEGKLEARRRRRERRAARRRAAREAQASQAQVSQAQVSQAQASQAQVSQAQVSQAQVSQAASSPC